MAINFPPSPTLFQRYTYEGVTYAWSSTEWIILSTKNYDYAFNQIQINDTNQFDAFNLRNLNFRGINLNIFSADSHTLVFSGQQMSNSVTSITESNNSVVVRSNNNTSSTFTIDAVTGGSYSNGVITFSGTGNVNGIQISGFSSSSSFSGGTVNGPTNFTNGLTANTISATTYLNLPTNISDSYIFSSNNSDIGGYEQMVILPLFVPNAIASIVTTVSTSPTLLANFATNLNYPNTTVIPLGIVTIHFETQKNTGTNAYECFVSLYKRNLAGTETLLGTSDVTSEITTNVVIQQLVSILLPTNVTILTTDRIVVKIYANVISGVNRNITLFYDDATNSRLQLPVTSVSIAGLVPYTGATTNVNLGSNSLIANTISATTYQNLPATPFLPLSGGTINGNLTVTGTTSLGNGTFTKSGSGRGDVLVDNNGTDTPGVLFYYANNSNYGIDSWNATFDVLSGQLFRITNNLNESGGAVKMAIDTSGNMVVTGFIKANAWRAGQVINDIMLSNTDVTISTTTIATSNSDTDFLTYSYTPLSSSSYLVIHYHLASFSFEGGTGNDSYFSRIKVDGGEITYSRQSTVNGNRTGVLFPLTGRYTNSNTTAKSIVVACRRDSADDSITIVNSSSSMWLRITEIAR